MGNFVPSFKVTRMPGSAPDCLMRSAERISPSATRRMRLPDALPRTKRSGGCSRTSFNATLPRPSAMTEVARTKIGTSEENHPHRCDDKPESGQGGSADRKLLRVADAEVCDRDASKQQRVTRTHPERPCNCDEDEQNPTNQEKTPSRDSLPHAEMGAGIFDIERVSSDGSKVSDVAQHDIQYN